MGLNRNSDQGSKTLIEFYEELRNSADPFSQGIGEHMLFWIKRINSELPNTKIWGSTSHDHLVLQTEDDYTSRTHVVIVASTVEYQVEYLIPEQKAPWDSAWIKGTTRSLDEAMRMLKIAMVNSNGWDKSEELSAE